MLDKSDKFAIDDYVKAEGFTILRFGDTFHLRKDDRLIYGWGRGSFSHIELVLAVYAAICDPFVTSN